MVKPENEIYKKAFLMFCWMLFSFIMLRFTNGAYGLVFSVIGVWAAITDKPGWALAHYLLLTISVVVNPILLPKGGIFWNLAARGGPIMIGFALIVAASRVRGTHRLPLGGLIPFLGVACISSSIGWVPQISYMKLVNFAVFLAGIWLGTQNMQYKRDDLFVIRAMFLATATFFIAGSLALLPFPDVSYLTALAAYQHGGGAEAAHEAVAIMREMIEAGTAGGYSALFCGVANQSQALAPTLALAFAWVTCDMLFIEKRVRWPHLGLMIVALPLLYLTRSRVGILSLVAILFLIYFYAIRKVRVSPRTQSMLKRSMFGFLAAVALVAVVAELHGNTVTRWLRKTNDLEGDRRSFSEAFTESRMGLMEESLYEFNRSPMFGSGFQVSYHHLELMQNTDGFIYSAPIEKGLLPLMVLGETGIVGAVCFLGFLIAFVVTAQRRRLFITVTLFGVLFVTNFGEATFFSPGGMGGILWMFSVVGGFMIDTMLLNERYRMRR